jgi:hypothetical protein
LVTVVPTSPEPTEAQADLHRARLRLYDAASELRPIDGPDDLVERVRAVARELQDIQESLLLYIHCEQLDSGEFTSKLEEVDKQLAAGWVPESAPVEDVIARLRANLKTSA